MRVAVIGANGQLGSELVQQLGSLAAPLSIDHVVPLIHREIELGDLSSVARTLSSVQPDCVINTAAFHNVVECERQPQQAYEINAAGAINLALVCRRLGASLVHLSTDYVFDGSKLTPYRESDPTRPLNVYGASKLAGERAIRLLLRQHFIIRTSGLYGRYPCRAKGENFVERMLRLAQEHAEIRVVEDEVLSPTFTVDLARQILRLFQTEAYGLYHVTSQGACSWYEFAQAVFSLSGIDANLQPTTADAFPRPVQRPSYSVLDNHALREARLDLMRPWREALSDYLAQRAAS